MLKLGRSVVDNINTSGDWRCCKIATSNNSLPYIPQGDGLRLKPIHIEECAVVYEEVWLLIQLRSDVDTSRPKVKDEGGTLAYHHDLSRQLIVYPI